MAQSIGQEEYQSLRAEILQWQQVRIALVTLAVTIVTGGVALALGSEELERGSPIVLSIGLLIFLGCVEYLSWYGGIGNRKIGSYIGVFHEGQGQGWEQRHGKLRKHATQKGKYYDDYERFRDRSQEESLSQNMFRIYALADRRSLDEILAFVYLVLGIFSFLPAGWTIWTIYSGLVPPSTPVLMLTILAGMVAIAMWLRPLWLLWHSVPKPGQDIYKPLWRAINVEPGNAAKQEETEHRRQQRL